MTRLVLFAVTAALMAATELIVPVPVVDVEPVVPDTATGSVIIIY